MNTSTRWLLRWHTWAPLLALAIWWGAQGHTPGVPLLALLAVALMGAVTAAVHHAELIALRVGEPFGTLVLALAVTAIEVALLVTLMRSGGEGAASLPRDTVYATVMIICNGVIGLCLMAGAWRHRVLAFRVDGTSPALAVLATLVTLALVLPSFTVSTPGPTLTRPQLIFAGCISLALYLVFVFVQTVRHREYFLPVGDDTGEDGGDAAPGNRAALGSLALLLVALVAVVGLAKAVAPSVEHAVAQAGMPRAVVGIVVALLVLLPETVAAVRAALDNRMQTSFNLALGSALATIGLTIPAVGAVSLAIDMPLVLGLPSKEVVLLALTLLVSSMTLQRGRATVMQGAVHLSLFSVFGFLAMVP